MKIFFAKYFKKLIFPLTILLVTINLINLFFIVEISPQSNDECLWVPKKINPDSSAIIFDVVKFEGVAWNAGIRDGDRLIAINGENISNTKQATLILNRVAAKDSADYAVEREGNVFNTKVEIKKLISFPKLGFTLMSLLWVIVGFVVLSAKPEGKTQRQFYLIGLLFTLTSLSSFFSAGYLQNPFFDIGWLVIIVDVLWLVSSVFLPFVIIHFFWAFPKPLSIIENKYSVRIMYIIPALIFMAALLYRIQSFYGSPDNLFITTNLDQVIMFGSLIFLLFIANIIGLISLFINYIKLKEKSERTPIFIILIAYAIGIISIIYTTTFANVLADTIFNSPEYFMPILAVILLPIAFGYSIFRYSLMDVTDVVKNTIYYGTATIVIAAIYFFIIYALGQNISLAIGSEYQGIVAAIIFIVFAMVFQSTKDKFQGALTKRFYPEQFLYQKILLKFINDINRIIGYDKILDATAEAFVNSLNIKHFAILLSNDDMFELKRGTGVKAENIVIKNNSADIVQFINEKKEKRLFPVIESNEYELIFGDDAEILIYEEIFTVVPLIIKSKIVGLLLFGLKHSGAQFAGKDLELLIASGNQVALALENARLYESEAEKLKIDRDLETARKIQESLLPKIIPSVNNLDICGKMIPAMQIGGDYYDLIKVSDNEIFVVIGDVSGKGLSASFYMSKLQTMINLYCKAGKSPKDILIEINKEIYGSIQKNWFITISLAFFNTEKNIVKFVRAGHLPLFVTKNDSTVKYTPSGIGVGLEKGDVFKSSLEELELPLNKGEIFTFFSDGINEAMNENGDQFGYSKICDVVESNSDVQNCGVIMSKLLNDVSAFQSKATQHDDITLVLVRSK